MSDIGWNFGTSNVDQGFNHPGIEHFTRKDNLYVSVARETLQNSLDAKWKRDEPVKVRFEKISLPVEQIPGHDELLAAFKSCLKGAKEMADAAKAIAFFKQGVELLSGDNTIRCLKIHDSNTTGLTGSIDNRKGRWHALTKGEGFSAGKLADSGGSFGIGKYAPFGISGLRTIFYHTRFQENDGKFCERALGKSILMSHDTGAGLTSATGFYELLADSKPLENESIPEFLRQEKDQGATLFVFDLADESSWRDSVTVAVISNYFYAIHQSNLVVDLIDTDRRKRVRIDNDMLPRLFRHSNFSELEEVQNAKQYYEIAQQGETDPQGEDIRVIEEELPKLGICKLRIKVSSDLPKRVAIIRSGMVITDQLPNLRRWDSFDDFAAVFTCEEMEGNRLLRDWENPAHDTLQPMQQNDDAGKEDRKTFKLMANWIRNQVKKEAGWELSLSSNIDELAELLPDTAPEEPLPGEIDTVITVPDDQSGTSSFPWRSKTPVGPNPNPNPRPGPNPAPKPGPEDPHPDVRLIDDKEFHITLVRIVPFGNSKTKKNVFFTPKRPGKVKMQLLMAGDSEIDEEEIELVSSHYETEDIALGINERTVDLQIKDSASIGSRIAFGLETRQPSHGRICAAIWREAS